MANSKGSTPTGSRARSVGAAGADRASNAALDNATELESVRRRNFQLWKEKKKKPSGLLLNYEKSAAMMKEK